MQTTPCHPTAAESSSGIFTLGRWHPPWWVAAPWRVHPVLLLVPRDGLLRDLACLAHPNCVSRLSWPLMLPAPWRRLSGGQAGSTSGLHQDLGAWV